MQLPSRRTLLIPKIRDLSDETDYYPIACLSTSDKLLTDFVGNYMRGHAIEYNITDERQLGAVKGVLGTVVQLIIDSNIIVKTGY